MRKYQRGAHVVYGAHGACVILDIEKKRVDKKLIEYYVLEPVDGPGIRYYIPTENEVAVAKLKDVLSEQQVHQLLASEQVRQDAWIEDEGQRKQRYKELITSGDRTALVSMIHTLHKHRDQQIKNGKKLHMCDENFLRDAEKLLDSEIALALRISQDEVGEVVKNAMK